MVSFEVPLKYLTVTRTTTFCNFECNLSFHREGDVKVLKHTAML